MISRRALFNCRESLAAGSRRIRVITRRRAFRGGDGHVTEVASQGISRESRRCPSAGVTGLKALWGNYGRACVRGR